MSRFRFLVLSVGLTITLFWPVMAGALGPNPNTCLPTCYAYNQASSEGNGTQGSPWFWDKDDDPDAIELRDIMVTAVKGKRNSSTLEVIDCNDTNPPQCTATLYTYNKAGEETSVDLGKVPVPDVGVPLPFNYILVLGGLAAALLIGSGLLLRRKAQRGTADS